jgi:hypothetical protein
MGFQASDLDNLVVLSYPIMATLDTHEGGQQVLLLAERHAAELVIIDTVSRVIAGEENSNDTWLQFYRHTGAALKRAGIAMLRLDHTGKDVTKGQRGASAKSSDVDMVWQLSEVVKDQTYQLTCTHNRMQVHEKVIVVTREQVPLQHVVQATGRAAAFRAGVEEIIYILDQENVPDEAGRDRIAPVLKARRGKVGSHAPGSPLHVAIQERQERWKVANLPGEEPSR